MTWRVLLVGLGRIGMGYDAIHGDSDRIYSHASAFVKHPAFSLVGAVDPEESRRREFAARYAVAAAADLRVALREAAPEVVVLATPTETHEECLMEVLTCKTVRAVLCEKPLSYDLGAARRMVERCAAAGVRLYVNYMRHADPGVGEVRERIQRGAFGAAIKGVCWYSKGLLHNGSHFVELSQFWLGSVQGGNVISPGRRLDRYDAEPDVRIQFERGAVVFLAAWEECYSHYTLELVSSRGRLRYERGGELIFWQGVEDDPEFPGYTVLAPNAESIPTGWHVYQWHVADQVARSLRGSSSAICSGVEALGVSEVLARLIDVE